MAADAELRRLIREGFECGIPGEQLAEASRSAVPHHGRRGAPLFVDGCGRADEPMHASHRPTEGVYGRQDAESDHDAAAHLKVTSPAH